MKIKKTKLKSTDKTLIPGITRGYKCIYILWFDEPLRIAWG